MKIRDIIITDVNGEDHYVKETQTLHGDNFQQTVFHTVFGEKITMKVEFSNIVAGNFLGEAKE